MRTVNAKVSVVRPAATLAALLVLLGFSTSASGQVAQSDYTAGYVVLPKIVVHTSGGIPPVAAGDQAFDTIIQMTNTNQGQAITVDCWWVNANKHCGTDQGPICETNADCPPGLQCVQGWKPDDFQVLLSPGQPIGFLASSGLSPLPCDPKFVGPGCIGRAGGAVKNVPEDPFRGELKCVQVDVNDIPVVENNLKIEATIVSTAVGGGGETTAAAYNGIGFTAESDGTGGASDPLCLGSLPPGTPAGVACAANYAPCPGVLHLEHFFENAHTELGSYVNTDLTLVPCSEDLGQPQNQANLTVTAQMLVYNEFEQRFSTSSRVSCYQATRLSDIDTPPGPAGDQFSIFNVGVEGTLTGQTRIHGVRGPDGRLGYGLLGVACESHATAPGGPAVSTTAFNLQQVGFRQEGDAVYKTQFPAP
ncbi:MAG TPA: hypothetical protein VL049_01505 [Candidatus Dormibacteraeota bacterium]|nr:hypothetical protein [Candidatus Dormibacteraeota bacterium]